MKKVLSLTLLLALFSMPSYITSHDDKEKLKAGNINMESTVVSGPVMPRPLAGAVYFRHLDKVLNDFRNLTKTESPEELVFYFENNGKPCCVDLGYNAKLTTVYFDTDFYESIKKVSDSYKTIHQHSVLTPADSTLDIVYPYFPPSKTDINSFYVNGRDGDHIVVNNTGYWTFTFDPNTNVDSETRENIIDKIGEAHDVFISDEMYSGALSGNNKVLFRNLFDFDAAYRKLKKSYEKHGKPLGLEVDYHSF